MTVAGTNTFFDVPTVTFTYNILATLAGTNTIHVGGTANVTTTVALASGLTIDVDGGGASFATTATAASVLTVNLNSLGTFTIGTGTLALLAGTSVTYGTNGGTFVTGSDNSFANITILSGISINNFDLPSDYIDDQAIKENNIGHYIITANGTASETIGFYTGNGGGSEKGSVQVTGNPLAVGTYAVGTGPLNITSDINGNLLFDPTCFLRGTRILAPEEEVAVEDLRLGDMVATRVHGTTVFQPVTWIGRRSVDVMSLGGNADGFPVRIRAGAFDENIPCRDLLVTQEHCIHANGRLIPVRMLVNGGSIVIDRDITQYEYFHVELEKHSILVAEGLETESYLDTGNRGNFANAPVPSLRPDLAVNAAHKSWEIDAAAPLATDPEVVEPIWRVLAERSAMSHATAHAVETTDEPDLTISIKGRSVRPIYADGGLYIFALPRGLTQTRLTSRSGAPSETRPWLNDRRRLGVKVQRITVRGAHEVRDVPLDHPGLSAGWWGIEQGDSGMLLRWTDGDAALPLPALKSMALLEIQVAATQTIVAETRRVA